MRTVDFPSLLTHYLTHYLPVQRNLSSNTIRSYRDTFKLLLLFCRDVKKFNISRLSISMLDKKCIEEFLLWLTNTRGASASTYNQRLCAIHAFFDYVIAEKPGLMEQCVQVLDIPHKVAHAPRYTFPLGDSCGPGGTYLLVLIKNEIFYGCQRRPTGLSQTAPGIRFILK